MELFILRHGRAMEREDWPDDDALRPLTDDGIRRCRKLFPALARTLHPTVICSSPWTRALQTAELAAEAWGLPWEERDWLAGGAADASERCRLLAEHVLADEQAPMLVGHEPDLGELVATLCGGECELKKAGLVALRGAPRPGGMELRALIPPRVIGNVAG